MVESDVSNDCDDASPRNLDVPFAHRKALRSSLIKHGGRNRSPGRKTVSFSSKNDDKKISNVADCWHYMQTGNEFVKLRGTSRQFRRYFSLDADLSHIRWTPTNKKPHKARIAIEDIKEIRLGKNTEMLRSSENMLGDLQEECIFSVIYGELYDSLDLVAACADDANIWVTGLMALTSNKYDCKPSSSTWATLRERWIESIFDEGDSSSAGFIDEATATRLIRQINGRIAVQRIRSKVKEAGNTVDEANRGKVFKNDFVELYKEIATRPEVYFLMVRYANKDYLSCQDLRLFLETEQGMVGVTTDFCESLIEQYEPAPEAKQNNFMTVDALLSLLHRLFAEDISRGRPVRPRHRRRIRQRPQEELPTCRDRPARPAGEAQRDGADDQERTTHEVPDSPESGTQDHQGGRIREDTVSIAVADLGALFNRLAESSRLITTHLGNKLYLPATDPTDWKDPKNIASPWDFQSKILVMARKIPKEEETCEVTEDEEPNTSGLNGKRRMKRIVVAKELSDLVPAFLQLRTLNDLMSTAPTSTTMNPRNHVPTVSESNCLRFMHNYGAEFAQTTRDYALRVTPNLSRKDSSNLNPQEFWNHGVQMVSLNYQTPGLMMDLQEGRFSENGGCGYVLKPEIMHDALYVPGEKIPVAPQGDSADPFVVVEVFGLPADCAEERTKTIRNDSHNPCFDESFQFQVSLPELALVRFLVLDDDFIGDDFIGQYTIPFECLQPGYRHIYLLNNEGDPVDNATLFVHIAITNRRGGGKAKKRGMSVKRRNSRINTGMKLVGIRSVDDQFKAAVAPLAESINMRSRLEAAMVDWQEECGLGPAGTIRQGIRLIHSRMTTLAVNASPPESPSTNGDSARSQETVAFYIDSDENNLPVVVVTGQVPEQLQRTFQKLKTLIGHCVTTLQQADNLLAKIEESIIRISNSHDELSQLCTETGLKGQKATRAAENFTWNLRLLKAQLNLMNKSQDEAQDVITQVFDTGGVLGILSDKLTQRRNVRRFSRVIPDPLKDSVL